MARNWLFIVSGTVVVVALCYLYIAGPAIQPDTPWTFVEAAMPVGIVSALVVICWPEARSYWLGLRETARRRSKYAEPVVMGMTAVMGWEFFKLMTTDWDVAPIHIGG